jgi:hypothetical protein
MNVEVTDKNMSKHLQTDLIKHQWALAGHEDNAQRSISSYFHVDFKNLDVIPENTLNLFILLFKTSQFMSAGQISRPTGGTLRRKNDQFRVCTLTETNARDHFARPK